MRKLCLAVLVCSLIIWGCVIGWAERLFCVEAEESTRKAIPWTPEVARQLVSLGWEDPAAPVEEPVVVYSLSFVELNAQLDHVIAANVQALNSKEEKSNVEVVVDEELLELVAKYPRSFVADFEAWQKKRSVGTGADAWLVTIGRQPVSVLLQEEDIKEDEEEHRLLQKFELVFEPQTIDLEAQRVLTNVSLDYVGRGGERAGSKSTLWITQTSERPLAVVSQQLTSNQSDTRRYYAMYAAATVLAPEQLPKDTALVQVGDVGKLRNMLFPEMPIRQYASELGFLLGSDGSELGLEAFIRQYLAENHLAAARVSSLGDEWGYELSLEWNVLDELRLVARVMDNPLLNVDTSLRVGLSDETRIGEKLYLRFSYFPAKLLLPEGNFSWDKYAEFILRLEGDRLTVWYKGELLDTEIVSQAGLELMMTPAFGFQAQWNEIPDESDRVLFGVVYKH